MDTEARRRSCRAWTEKPLFKEAKTTTDTCTERELGGISSDDDIGENANSEDTNMNESRADLSKLEVSSQLH